MKTIIFSLFFVVSAGVYGQTAIDYMNKINEQSSKIRSDFWDYTNAVAHGKSARKVDKRRTELISTSQSALRTVQNMKAFSGSTEYRDSVASYLQINLHILKEDYAKIVDMEEIAERSYDDMEAYILAQEAAKEKINAAGDMLQEEEKKFAEANNVQLIEGEETKLAANMKKASEVYAYYNEIYLIFFKSYIQEKYLLEAIGRNDVSAIEQNKSALTTTANEGLGKLKAIKSYAGDNTILMATKEVLSFYKDEAENKIAIITDYYLKTENFNTIKASFDQIKEKNRTQDDVDKYNNAVNEMNDAVNKLNETNAQLDKERADKLEAYNKAVAKFTDKHVPKGKAK